MSKQLVLAGFVAASMMTACAQFEVSREALSPAAPSPIPGGSSTGPLVGAWVPAQNIAPPDPSTCSNFQWTITSQSDTAIQGDFTADCGGGLSVAAFVSGTLTSPTTANITVTGNGIVSGLGCPFTLNGVGTISDDSRSMTIPYSGTTCFGPVSGTQTIRRPSPGGPAPAPEPEPAPGAGDPTDELDIRNIIILKGPASVVDWPVGSHMTAVQQGGGQLCTWHEQLGSWPATIFFNDPATLVEGNQWVFALINGQWYGGAADWYRPGQACKGVDASSIARDAFDQEPLRSWVPRPGETYGLMVTTPARAWPQMQTLDHRTNIVLRQWQ